MRRNRAKLYRLNMLSTLCTFRLLFAAMPDRSDSQGLAWWGYVTNYVTILMGLRCRGSGVRVSLGAPSLCFVSLEDQIEWLSVCRIDVYSVYRAVRKHHLRQFGLFLGWLLNIKKIGLVRQF
jgi:hypothetical protein